MSEKEEKWVFTGEGPEGKRYFKKVKVRKPKPEEPPSVPPEPPERPVSPTYPNTKPPREDVPMAGVPRGDRD